jgi:hypothetical protein
VSDGDDDTMRGAIAIGVSRHDRAVLRRDESFPILGDSVVSSGAGLFAANETLLFHVPGGDWRTAVALADLTSFPAEIAVRTLDRRLVDVFTIEAWSQAGVTIDRVHFTAHSRQSFTGTDLPSLDQNRLSSAGARLLRAIDALR